MIGYTEDDRFFEPGILKCTAKDGDERWSGDCILTQEGEGLVEKIWGDFDAVLDDLCKGAPSSVVNACFEPEKFERNDWISPLVEIE